MIVLFLFILLPFLLKMKEIGGLRHHAAGVCGLVSDSGIAEQFWWNFIWTLFNF